MRLSEFTDWLASQRDVVRVVLPTDDLMRRIEAEESTVTSFLGTPVDNTGLRDCLSRGTVVIAFVDAGFWQPPTETVLLRNSDGTVIGHDIHPSRVAEYAGRDDLTFISDEFVMYTDRCMDEAPYMEMLSQAYRGEDGSLPEETDAVLWFPSPTSSAIIHGEFGQPDEGLATAMIGLNLDPDG